MSSPKYFINKAGKSTNPHIGIKNILKYVPRARPAETPSMFYRRNMLPSDIKDSWEAGRGRMGAHYPNNPYNTEKTGMLEGHSMNKIPKHELEKYMPDIYLGPKALVTPVSLMSARAGHRVTHDMIHSYDPYIGQVDKPAVIDHDSITPQDPNRVGLHPGALYSRSRIFRWLRRGPFFQDDHYFRHNVAPGGDYVATVTPEDVRLAKQVIRLAKRGKMKEACEQYRKFITVPPVQVYRALTAACIPQARLGDAIAIFMDGHHKLFYVTHDRQVLMNVMTCAIKAKNRTRIMWLYDIARGNFRENKIVRIALEPMTLYRLVVLGMEACCDNGWVEEARIFYRYLNEDRMSPLNEIDNVKNNNLDGGFSSTFFLNVGVQAPMTEYDLYYNVGLQMRKALESGNKIPKFDESMIHGLASYNNAELLSTAVAQKLQLQDGVTEYEFGSKTDAIQYLSRRFPDLNVLTLMRLARYDHLRKKDLLSSSKGNGKNKAEERRKAKVLDKNHEGSDEDVLSNPNNEDTLDDDNTNSTTPISTSNTSEEHLFTTYLNRVTLWLSILSTDHQNNHYSEQNPLPYLRKSKPSSITPSQLRVAWCPQNRKTTKLLPHEAGFSFYYNSADGSQPVRFVEETFPQAGVTPASKYLALQPIHQDVSGELSFPHRTAKVQYDLVSGAEEGASLASGKGIAKHLNVSDLLLLTPPRDEGVGTTAAAAVSSVYKDTMLYKLNSGMGDFVRAPRKYLHPSVKQSSVRSSALGTATMVSAAASTDDALFGKTGKMQKNEVQHDGKKEEERGSPGITDRDLF